MTLNQLWMATSNMGGWLNELCVIKPNGCAVRALNLNETLNLLGVYGDSEVVDYGYDWVEVR
jgi:hypothetical protein|nr:MAG TPA: hypothetical protein [Caudoviricetes sp.]